MLTGQLAESREHLERALKLFETEPIGNSGALQNYEMTGAAAGLNTVLAALGYPATALRKNGELLDSARRMSDPVLLASILVRGNMLFHLLRLRDSQPVAEQLQELVSIATEYGLTFRLTQAKFSRGWLMAAAGKGQEGVAEMQRAMSDIKTFGWTSIGPLFLPLAEACRDNGLPEQGLEVVTEGLAETARIFDAELSRLKGELLLIRDASAEAEAEGCFRASIDSSRSQGARWCELRATISLARLLKSQGNIEEARKILSDIYGWFTEGFEFADLKDAKALLDDLRT